MGNETYSPQEITAFILARLKKNAEVYLNSTVTQAVLSVPAVFNFAQRNALIDSCKIAGLQVLRIISESTAFSLNHHFGSEKQEIIMILNLGGGFISTSIIDIGSGVWEVKSTSGKNNLGGDDFDLRVMDYIVGEFKKQQNIDLRDDCLALQRLKEAAEKVRIELSTTMESEINLPCVTADASGPKNLLMAMARSKLERLTIDLIELSIKPAEQALKDSGLRPHEISEVFLVGGMARMPKVQEIVKEKIGIVPHTGFNPNEIVAFGAAIQAGVLSGDVKDVLLMNVVPQTLSIETTGGVATPLVERNTIIPTIKRKTFSTTKDGQTQVEILVLEGEQPMAADNTNLGRFTLDGISPAAHGLQQIDVTFEIDANSTVNVTAQDQATGRSQKVTAIASSGLSDAEIEQAKIRLEKIATKI
jgi:molecular chaperone DnaK